MSLILRGGDTEKDCELKRSEVNHLRLLLGWVRCEIGKTPEEFEETMRKIAPAITHPISEDSKQRVMKSYQKSVNVPIYLRQAVKMLSKKLREHEQAGDIADGKVMRNRLEVARMKCEK